MRALLVLLMVCLAGCQQAAEPDPVEELEPGKGAIAGLLVDDRYRPLALGDGAGQIPGFILLQETGDQIASNGDGVFTFTDLEPGTYTVRASLDGHEASPAQLTVEEGEFTELTLLARRVASDGTVVVTQEYSGFVPCATGGVVAVTFACTYDASGDSYRPGPILDYTGYPDLQYIIIEATANQAGDMSLVFREDDISGSGGDEYGRADTESFDAPYMKMILADTRNVAVDENETTEPYPTNAFPNDFEAMESLVFYWGEEPAEEIPAGPYTVSVQGGARAALEFRYVISMFMGPPEVDLQTYCALCEGTQASS